MLSTATIRYPWIVKCWWRVCISRELATLKIRRKVKAGAAPSAGINGRNSWYGVHFNCGYLSDYSMDFVYLQLKMKCWTRSIRFKYLFGWVISKVSSKHANMLPNAQLIGTSCKNLSVLCGQMVSLTVNCDYFHWLLATDSNFYSKRRFTFILPTGVNSGFFTNWSRAHCAIRIRTKDTGRRYFVRVYLWRTVTNTGNHRKFLAHEL